MIRKYGKSLERGGRKSEGKGRGMFELLTVDSHRAPLPQKDLSPPVNINDVKHSIELN